MHDIRNQLKSHAIYSAAMLKLSEKGKMTAKIVLLWVAVLSWCTCQASAGVTSSFVRSEWPSDDIPLDSEIFAVPPGYNAPQQVHITQGDYEGKAVYISWVTPDEPGSKTVRYGLSPEKLDFIAQEVIVLHYKFYTYQTGYLHHCLIDGLQYNTTYYYEVGDGDSSRSFWFKTPLPVGPDAPQKIAIIGDLGQTYNSLSTMKHALRSGADSVLFVGDLSYADRYRGYDVGLRWDTWGRFLERSAAYYPWIWCAGNHDIEYFPDMGEVVPFFNYVARYPTPYLASNSSRPLWYSIRRASAHIIVLSSYSPYVKYTPQYIWLAKELENVDREKTPWLIVLMHAPIYNSNYNHSMEAEGMRLVFESWFVRYKVDIVFAGHVHAYERTYRISNIDPEELRGPLNPIPDKSAPVYVNVGDGGNQEGLAQRYINPQPEFSAFREASYGHSTLEIINRSHAFYHWNRNDDGKRVKTDSIVLLNQCWTLGCSKTKSEENHPHSY